jgi:hypothetical protein
MKIKTALFIVGMAGTASAGVPGNLTTEGGDHNLSLARGQVRTPQRLTDRDIHVHYTGDQFMIKDEGASQMLSPAQVRGVPDNVSVEQLEEFLKHGHFFLSEQNGEYDLEARVSGKGGVAPLLALLGISAIEFSAAELGTAILYAVVRRAAIKNLPGVIFGYIVGKGLDESIDGVV